MVIKVPENWKIKGRKAITGWFIKEKQMANKHIKKCFRDFPGGAVVKNPPANAGDKGLSPGPGRSHMPWSN